MWFYQDKKRSFHPKAYIFHYGDMGEIYIGSSNIFRSALTSGIEWDHRFSSLEDQEDLRLFCETFEDLFAHHSIVVDDQELRVICSVDMFNEGVDIAPLDMVMFLRPTEPSVVFLQQLGRGLRASKGKTYLNVLDFTGNYENPHTDGAVCRGGADLWRDRKGISIADRDHRYVEGTRGL